MSEQTSDVAASRAFARSGDRRGGDCASSGSAVAVGAAWATPFAVPFDRREKISLESSESSRFEIGSFQVVSFVDTVESNDFLRNNTRGSDGSFSSSSHGHFASVTARQPPSAKRPACIPKDLRLKADGSKRRRDETTMPVVWLELVTGYDGIRG